MGRTNGLKKNRSTELNRAEPMTRSQDVVSVGQPLRLVNMILAVSGLLSAPAEVPTKGAGDLDAYS
jgi:hypothetical protein